MTEDQTNDTDLKYCVKELFKILDTEEESDSGRVFRPTYITSCRLIHIKELELLFPKIRRLISD